MTKKSKSEVFLSVIEHTREAMDLDVDVLGVFLQGSQNYQLDYEGSDVDTKAIIVPSMKDIVLNRSPISRTHIRENNEHIDLKDIRTMFNTIKKQNINFVEILFTNYMTINPKYKQAFQPILDNREKIARYNLISAVNCMSGMAMEKYKALEHPYPSILHKIEKYGYDAKQLHHIIRMREFIERYLEGEPYIDCLTPRDKEYLIEVKKGCYNIDEARRIAIRDVEEIKKIKNYFIQTNGGKDFVHDKEVDSIMEKVLFEVCSIKFKEELL